MKILDSKFMKGFIKMADDGFQQGWHERNGGNLSYRLKNEEVEMIRPRLNAPGEWQPIGTEVPGLAGEFFLVTGSGKYFRNIAVDPEACLAIIELDDKGVNYRIRWGLVEGGRPTSELPTHLMNHEVKKKLTNGKHRVIYHAHTTNTIALTFVLPLEDRVFTRELWESATECPVVFPDGVGVVGWMVPGGREIAVKTAELMKKYDVVIWAHHGMFCSGEDFDLTFGLLHTVEKSAERFKEEFVMSKVIMVTGGSRSGKSVIAEQKAKEYGKRSVLYLATAIPVDDDMKERIRIHQERRDSEWGTYEGYRDLGEVVKSTEKNTILLDCVTVMITNILCEDEERDFDKISASEVEKLESEVIKELSNLVKAIRDEDKTLIIVSNEVGMSVVPSYRLGRIFSYISGKANQVLASLSDEVYVAISGLPLRLK